MKNLNKIVIFILLSGNYVTAQTEVGVTGGASLAMLTGTGLEIIHNNSGRNYNFYAEKKFDKVAIQARLFAINNNKTTFNIEDCYDGCQYKESIINVNTNPLHSYGLNANVKVNIFNDFYFISFGMGIATTRSTNYTIQTSKRNYSNPPSNIVTSYSYKSKFAYGPVFSFSNGVKLPLRNNIGLILEISYQRHILSSLTKTNINLTGNTNPDIPFQKENLSIDFINFTGGLCYNFGKTKKARIKPILE